MITLPPKLIDVSVKVNPVIAVVIFSSVVSSHNASPFAASPEAYPSAKVRIWVNSLPPVIIKFIPEIFGFIVVGNKPL